MDILKIRKRAQAQRASDPEADASAAETAVSPAPHEAPSDVGKPSVEEAPGEAPPVEAPRAEEARHGGRAVAGPATEALTPDPSADAAEERVGAAAFDEAAFDEAAFDEAAFDEATVETSPAEEPSPSLEDVETIVVAPPAPKRSAAQTKAEPTQAAKSRAARTENAQRKPAKVLPQEDRGSLVEEERFDAELEEAFGEIPDVDFDDPLADFLARYDAGVAPERKEAVEHDDLREESKRYLAFYLEDEEYAVSIMDVREILRVVALTEVPRAPREVLGILSKRGVVMPVIDLGALLKLRPPDPHLSAHQRILVVGEGDRVCGLRIDRMQEVVRLRVGDIEEVPASLGARSVHLLRGLGRVGDRILILLDMDAVLHGLAVSAGLESREEVAS